MILMGDSTYCDSLTPRRESPGPAAGGEKLPEAE